MLTYNMQERGQRPLYEHLYRCIRADIEQGRIAPDERLPSKRALARNLGVSVITVEGAYTQLIAEGYLRTEQRKGYYACTLPQQTPTRTQTAYMPQPELPLKRTGSNEPEDSTHCIADLTGQAIAQGLFPYSVWAKNLRSILAEESEWSLIGESSTQGSLRLRTALSNHLRGTRGMEVSPEQIVVGAGAQYLYGMVVQLLGHANVVALEDPGYPRLSSIYAANGVATVPVALDKEGISAAGLDASPATLAHIMPSHQFPTGIVTSIARRYELLGWAARSPERFIIEDDYDCELRLAGKPVPSLQSIDTQGRVIYINTFAKTLGPAFRIGYLVLPSALAERYNRELGFYSCTVSAIDQLALARFIESGEYERHLNRMRSHYRSVRDKLVTALKGSALGPRIQFKSLDSGIHFVLSIESDTSEEQLASSACGAGVLLRPLCSFSSQPANLMSQACKRLVVSYAGLDPKAIPSAIAALENAWRHA